MNIEKLLQNNITILTSEINQGKSMVLCNIIIDYTSKYTGDIYTYGLSRQITDQMKTVRTFSSILELERIHDGIVLIDEVSTLFDLNNRRNHRMVEKTLRMTSHNNNKIIMAGLPDNFRKFLSSLATGFMFKSLVLKSMINGSHAKEILEQYALSEKGAFTLDIPKNKVLCYSETFKNKELNFWIDDVIYYKQFDTKVDNSNLFEKRKNK